MENKLLMPILEVTQINKNKINNSRCNNPNSNNMFPSTKLKINEKI